MSIHVDGLTHVYNPGTPHEQVALRDISLRIADGECVGIVGVTGSGKSTLVQHFNGLLHPTNGSVHVDEIALTSQGTRKAHMIELRRRVGLLFQFPEAQLFAPTVYDDVAFGPRQLKLKDNEIRERVHSAMRAVALGDDVTLLYRSPFALSGGQRRRVALAGVLAMRPRVLVLDEPSAGLDAEARDELYAQLLNLRVSEGLTIVLVSHDMSEVANLADTVFVLANGELRLSGPPEEVFQRVDDILACGLLPPPLAQAVTLARERGYSVTPDLLTPERVAEALALAWQTHKHSPTTTPAHQETPHAS